MRLLLVAALIASAGLQGQTVVNPARLSPKLINFDWRPDDDTLKCDVAALKPALNFGFRFQAGYIVRVPMEQYVGAGHRWAMLMRITPVGGTPIYMASNYRLPDVPKYTKTEVEVGGGYLLGLGKYDVAWRMYDDTGRNCRKDWSIEVKLAHSERLVKVAMEPSSVKSFSSLRDLYDGHRGPDDAAPVRLTVLLHAAPGSPRRTRLGARDRVMLMGTLSSLLDRLPASSVRLVVFNLDKQKVLFRQDDFAVSSLDQVSQAVDTLELDLVDVHVLENRRGHVDLLAGLMNEELNAQRPSDLVLFVGPMARYVDKMPEAALRKPEGQAPRFVYLQYRPPFRVEATLPDIIHSAVSRLKGRTMVIHSPGEFAKAIERVEKRK